MSARGFQRLFLILAAALGTTPAASPTIIRSATLAEYCAIAQSIVRGTVRRVTPVIPKEGMAYTEVELHVQETWKGPNQTKVILRVPGARTAEIIVAVAAAPAFEIDEEVVLFIERVAGNVDVVSGLSQGVYRVRRDPKTAEVTLRGLHTRGMTANITAFRERVGEELATLAKTAGGGGR